MIVSSKKYSTSQNHSEKFEADVNRWLEEGYDLYGDLKIVPPQLTEWCEQYEYYIQALVMYTEEENNNE